MQWQDGYIDMASWITCRHRRAYTALYTMEEVMIETDQAVVAHLAEVDHTGRISWDPLERQLQRQLWPVQQLAMSLKNVYRMTCR